jgi:hypothetical protein
MTIDHLDKYRAQIEARPTPTEQQWHTWAVIVADRAPDLAEMLLGERAGGGL